MNSFEERLYNHWMYTDALSNMIYDMGYEIRETFGESSVSLEKYTSGKYATLTVNDGVSIVAVISHIEYTRDQDESYYKDLRFKVENNKILFYIEI
jgi:hypothetical protein